MKFKNIFSLVLLVIFTSLSLYSINMNLFKKDIPTDTKESEEELAVDSLYQIIEYQDVRIDSMQSVIDSLLCLVDSLSQQSEITEDQYSEGYHFELPEKYSFCGREVDLKNERIRSKLQTILDYEIKKAYKFIPRSTTYFPYFDSVISTYDLHPDIKYLAVAESYLSYMAYSSVGAAGIWQFMPGTAKMFNLTINDYLDERRNVLKATDAACRYLINSNNYLSQKGINDWLLVLASYNAGMGNITKVVSEQNANDFFSLIMRHDETNDYIWRAIAIKIIFEHEEEIFGKAFNRDPNILESNYVAEVKLNGYHELNDWAAAQGTNISKVWELNPWIKISKKRVGRYSKLNKLILPPGEYKILIPRDAMADSIKVAQVEYVFLQKSSAPATKTDYITHKVKKGETLTLIAKKYGVTISQIKQWNHIRRNKLKSGMRLKINREVYQDSLATDTEIVKNATDKPNNSLVKQKQTYIVKSGDTISKISRKIGISQEDLIEKNGLKTKKVKGAILVNIQKGQVLYY